MSDKPIKHLSIYLPHGATMQDCHEIALRAGEITGAQVSSGGFTPRGDFGIQDDTKFCDDSASFELGYLEPENIEVRCRCGATWVTDKNTVHVFKCLRCGQTCGLREVEGK